VYTYLIKCNILEGWIFNLEKDIKEKDLKQKDNKKIKNKKVRKKDNAKFIYFTIAAGLIVLFILMLLSSIIDVGERLGKVHEFVEYGFYALTVLLIYFLILRPLFIIFFSPSFSVETTLDSKSHLNYKLYKKIAKRLLEHDDLDLKLREKLANSFDDYDTLKNALYEVFDKHVKKTINRVIRNNAKTVMISTAISQNGRLDFFTVIVVNLKMIKEIVLLCGFRPSFKNLAKLCINVITTALIAEGLENLNLSDVLPQSAMNTISEIPFLKPVLSSVTQGISNALLTLRIGIVTRKYLFSDAKELTKEEIRKGALIEAASMLPLVIADGLIFFPKKIVGLFKKNNVDPDDEFTYKKNDKEKVKIENKKVKELEFEDEYS
jgi:hypothetical protein